MKRVILPVVFVLLAIAGSVATAWYLLNRGAGSGPNASVTEERSVGPFRRIEVEGLVELNLVEGPAEHVAIEAATRLMPDIEVDVADETLRISAADRRRWWSFITGGGARPARITVTFRQLESIRAAGAVKIAADRLAADRLVLRLAGASEVRIGRIDTRFFSLAGAGAVKVDVAGRTAEQKIAISGAGNYRGAELVSEAASIAVSGAAKVVVNASRTLDVRISGAGQVEYLGDPTITQHIGGVGKVFKRHG